MIKLIGLGKMGLNLLYNMVDNNIYVQAHDVNDAVKLLLPEGCQWVQTLEEIIDQNVATYWLMLPSGEITEKVFMEVVSKAQPGSIIIDGGNAHYSDSVRRYMHCKEKGLSFLDVGVSGGQTGARDGACMMVGGDFDVFQRVEPMIAKICVNNGYLYTGKPGSGHYLKMIHNGIEYGMMQAIAEGYNILMNNDRYDYEMKDVSSLFNNGSVIRSWLIELLIAAFDEDPSLEKVAGVIDSSGEGKWTMEEVLRLGLNAPVIAQSVLVRFASKDELKYGERVTASLRNQFGGHEVKKRG